MIAGPGSLLTPNLGHPLNQGRKAWWLTLPHTYGGGRLVDLYQSAHGTSIGPAKWRGTSRKGGFGSAYFDSTNYYAIPKVASLSAPGGMTVSGWFYQDTLGAGFSQVFFINTDATLTSIQWLMGLADDSTVSFGWDAYRLSVGAFTFKTWTHFVATRSGTTGAWTAKNYLNGKLVATDTTIINPSALQATTTIGDIGVTLSRPWRGPLDDISLWNRALSAQEVWELYQDSLSGYSGTLLRKPRAGTVYGPPLPRNWGPATGGNMQGQRGGVLTGGRM